MMALMTACGKQAPEQQLTGHLEGLQCDSLVVMVLDDTFARQDYADTIACHDGNFAYDLRDKSQLRQVVLLPKGERRGSISVLLVPGEWARIDGQLSEYYYSGSAFYEDYNQYDRSTSDLQIRLTALMNQAQQSQQDGTANDSSMMALQEQYAEITAQLDEAAKAWIAANPTKDVSAYIISSLHGADFDAALEQLDPVVRQGRMAPFLQSFIDRYAAQKAREEAAARCSEGAQAPDFTVLSPEGKEITLTSLRGKGLVLDFWGSWCHWCIKGIPDMKEAYKKYSKKVEFLSIACNDTDEKWRAALAEQQMPWLQAINGKDQNDVSILYGISGYPTKIILDAEGKIVKVMVGEDPAFYELLKELFK